MLMRQTGQLKGEQGWVQAGEQLEAAVAATCSMFEGQRVDRPNMKTQQVTDRVLEALD